MNKYKVARRQKRRRKSSPHPHPKKTFRRTLAQSTTRKTRTVGAPVLTVGAVFSLASLKDGVISPRVFSLADLLKARTQTAVDRLRKPQLITKLKLQIPTVIVCPAKVIPNSPPSPPTTTVTVNCDNLIAMNQTKPTKRASAWKDSSAEVQRLAIPRADFVGNGEVFGDVFALVQSDVVTRGMCNINILTGPCGSGKDAIIMAACKAANRRCIMLHPSELLSGVRMDRFLKQLENTLQPPDESRVVLSGCEILSTLQMEGLLAFCRDRMCTYPHLYRPLWITTMNTAPLLVQYILHREPDFEPHAQVHYLRAPLEREILKRFPAVPRGIMRCMQGDMRRIREYMSQKPNVRSRAQADIEMNPFTVVPRLLKGSRLSTFPPFTEAEIPKACLAVVPMLDKVTDLLFENVPALLKAGPRASPAHQFSLVQAQLQFSELLSDVDLMSQFRPGEFVNAQSADLSASILCQGTQLNVLRSLLDRFHIGAKHSELSGKRLELEGNKQMMLSMQNDDSKAILENHGAVLNMAMQWPASGNFEWTPLPT